MPSPVRSAAFSMGNSTPAAHGNWLTRCALSAWPCDARRWCTRLRFQLRTEGPLSYDVGPENGDVLKPSVG